MKQRLTDIATLERSRKGKQYPAGCTLIQLSATHGQTIYLKNQCAVEDKYAVINPKIDVLHKYLYYEIERQMPDFCKRYQTGLNIVPEQLANLYVEIPDIKKQIQIVSLLDQIETSTESEEHTINSLENLKRFMLHEMFV